MKQRWKKPLSWLLTLSLVLSLFPAMWTTALADEAEAETKTVTTWADLQAAFESGGSVTLGEDITASADNTALTVPDNTAAVLNLNGHTLNRGLTEPTSQGYVICVNGTLTIQDSSENQEGNITGGYNSESAGGGIYVNEKGTLNFSGGTISGNKANFGSGVYVKGTMNMTDGKITANTADTSGGGIYADSDSTLTLQGGYIYKNKTNGPGAGVFFAENSHGIISNIYISSNEINNKENDKDDSNNANGAGIAISDDVDVKISGSPYIYNNYRTVNQGSYINDIFLGSNVLKVTGTLGDKANLGIVRGGSDPDHYVAVGSDGYSITDSDRNKFTSDSIYYAIKPLNTDVEGHRIELGDAGTIRLESEHVTIAFTPAARDEKPLTSKNLTTTALKGSDFTFTVTPEEGYAKTADFAVKCDRDDKGQEPLTAKDGSYTINIDSDVTKLYVYGIERQYTVKFETSGGSNVKPQKMFSGDKATRPEAPAREGYTFGGWYSDKALKTEWDFDKAVTADITLYAKWTAIPYTVSGKVTGSTDEDMTGTVVKLMNNDETVKETTVDNAAGQFSFSDVTVGSYRILAVKGERRASLDLAVKENTENIALQLPDSNLETEIKVNENTPKVTVSGLEELARDSKYAPAPNSGDVVRITLNVAALDESALPAETVSAIKNLSGSEILTYLNMDIERYVNGTKAENITDTGDHVQAVTIDFDTARRNISVYRVHDGKAMKLTAAGSTPADGTYRVNDGSITIYSAKFSIYAIGYTAQSSGGHSSSGGSSVSTFPVEVKSAAGGTVKADKSTAAKGATVTITVTPDSGYELGRLTVTDKDGKAVSVSAKGNGQYTFTMPAGKASVSASFTENSWNLSYRDCPKDSTCPIAPFTDAKATDWYHDGVHFCLENKLMVGYGENTFKPDDSTSRAMIAVMLWRLNGSPVVNYAMDFEDVKADAWYTEAIRWAVSEGMATGYGDGKFGPDDAVTREQMVTILWRYAKYKGYDVSVGEDTNILSYDDATSIAHYAIPAMQWACGSGMVRGSGYTLLPQGETTRAQMATMMMRFCAEITK